MQAEPSPWKQVSSRIAYQNPWIQVREDQVIRPDGSEGLYGVIVSPPIVMIVAVTTSQEVYMINQYRYPIQAMSFELPGGSTDGQDPLFAAKRELREETGLTAKNWKQIGRFETISGLSDEYFYVYLALDLKQNTVTAQEAEGITSARAIPFQKAISMVLEGELTDSQSISSLLVAGLHLGVILR